MDETISFIDLVDTIKQRWRIERDYLELKQEVGLGHFEGRGWRGLHHHAMLCIAAYGFLVMERAAFPPPQKPAGDYSARNLPFPKIIDPEAPPLRTERHQPHSLTTVLRKLTIGLAKTLDRCPCCCQSTQRSNKRVARMTK